MSKGNYALIVYFLFFAGFETWRGRILLGVPRHRDLLLVPLRTARLGRRGRGREDAVEQGGGGGAGVAAVEPVRQGGHALRQGEAGGVLQEDGE